MVVREALKREIIFLSAEAFDSMSTQEQDFLCARMSDPLFFRFIEKQLEAANKQRNELDPDGEISDEEFRRLSREFFLVQSFWAQFRDFSQAWIARSTSRNQ